MLPEAPGRFSTMKPCPSISLTVIDKWRAMISVAPPGAYGTRIFTGRFGYGSALCAAAGSAANASAAQITVPTTNRAARGKRLAHISRAAANWIMLSPRWLAQIDQTCTTVPIARVFLFRDHDSAILPVHKCPARIRAIAIRHRSGRRLAPIALL